LNIADRRAEAGLRPRALRAAWSVHEANGLAQESHRRGARVAPVPL